MLNHAAALVTFLLATLSLSFFVAAPAWSLDGIDLSEPAEPAAEGECPRLIQIKYPFLSCPTGQIGQSDRDETWDNMRHMPIQGDWNEGDGYWGPTLNVD